MKTVILKNLYQGENSVKMMIRNGEKIYQQLTKFVFDVDKDRIEFPASGGTDTLTITANEPWTMTVPAWLTASAVSGRSSATITITSQPTQTSLQGNIVITCNGVQKTVSVSAIARDYSREYFTIKSIGNSGIHITPGKYSFIPSSYATRLNGGEWSLKTGNNNFTLTDGDELSVRFAPNSNIHPVMYFTGSTGTFSVEGNIMSLIYGDSFHGRTFDRDSACTMMFSGCTGLSDASNLVLPVEVTNSCYYEMFHGCRSLATAPALPATALATSCYFRMFSDCKSLTTAPALPATTLAEDCYDAMFMGCSSLITAPALPATALATNCYTNMFRYCTSLTSAPALPATALAQDCYVGMFAGCTGITTAPELPATTLANGCYYYMFYGCTNLNYIKCLATDISASNCTGDWVGGVAASGTFVKKAGMTWPTGNSGIPSGWTVIEE